MFEGHEIKSVNIVYFDIRLLCTHCCYLETGTRSRLGSRTRSDTSEKGLEIKNHLAPDNPP